MIMIITSQLFNWQSFQMIFAICCCFLAVSNAIPFRVHDIRYDKAHETQMQLQLQESTPREKLSFYHKHRFGDKMRDNEDNEDEYYSSSASDYSYLDSSEDIIGSKPMERPKEKPSDNTYDSTERNPVEDLIASATNVSCSSAPKKDQRLSSSFVDPSTRRGMAERQDDEMEPKIISSIHVGEDVTLCWIETTTIKENKSVIPPVRLVIREYTISFENSATIPDPYLECSRLPGEMKPGVGDDENLGKKGLFEIIDEDTRKSRVVNFTIVDQDGEIVIWKHKKVQCGVGPVVRKNILEWSNGSTSNSKKRVEINVSPKLYGFGVGSQPSTTSVRPIFMTSTGFNPSTVPTLTTEKSSSDDISTIITSTVDTTRDVSSTTDTNTETSTVVTECCDTDSTESTEFIGVTEPTKPSEPTGFNESTELTESTEPTKPTKPTEPIELTESMESTTAGNEATVKNISLIITTIKLHNNYTLCKAGEMCEESSKTVSTTEASTHSHKSTPSNSDESCSASSSEYCDSSEETTSEKSISVIINDTKSTKDKPQTDDQVLVESTTFSMSGSNTLPSSKASSSKTDSTKDWVTTELTFSSASVDGSVSTTTENSIQSTVVSTEDSTNFNRSPVTKVPATENTKSNTDTTDTTPLSTSSETKKSTTDIMYNTNKIIASSTPKNDKPCDPNNSSGCTVDENIMNSTPSESTENCTDNNCYTVTEKSIVENQTLSTTVMTGETGLKEAEKNISITTGSIPTTMDTRRSTIPTLQTGTTTTDASSTGTTTVVVRGITTTAGTKHRLALKIKVMLEHINERKEKQNLIEVEKHLLLNEDPHEHSNNSILNQVQALNDSISFQKLQTLFNCSSLEKLNKRISKWAVAHYSTSLPEDQLAASSASPFSSGTRNQRRKRRTLNRNLNEDLRTAIHGLLDSSLVQEGGKNSNGAQEQEQHGLGNNFHELRRWTRETLAKSSDGLAGLNTLTEFSIYATP